MSKIRYLDELSKLLETKTNCSICLKEVNEPILSKCQKRCCKKCFAEMLEKNSKLCSLCNQMDDLKEAHVDLRGETYKNIFKTFKSYLRTLEETFKYYDTKCIYFLDEHFKKMINQIDIYTETSIKDNFLDQSVVNELNKTRDLYLGKINTYKDECQNKRDDKMFQAFFDSLKKRFDSLEEKSKDWTSKLESDDQTQLDIVYKEIREIKVNFLAEKADYENKLFQEKFYSYDSNTNELKMLDKHITEQDQEVAK